ncbi:MAG TPA: DNA alkylation repair protein [Draconibacterium sp.]|nr:DNA alkylation repair protein [Draconibacterium sp.]
MIAKIIAELESVADPVRKEASKTMFPTSLKYLGVRTPDLRKLLNQWWVTIKTWPPEKLIQFAKELVKTRIFECNQLAFEILWKNKNALRLIQLKDLEELGKNMDNWATTDTFSVLLSGWVWREGQITDADIINWLKSDNRWWRRTAIVSTVPLNLRSRGGTGDAKRTLMICEKVVSDRDDMIVKALSWALRELSKSDKPAVEEFMENYDSQLAGRVKREVYTKLETGRKNG